MSEHASAQRTTNSQTSVQSTTSTTAETATTSTLDARQLTSARIMQMQRTMGNRAVQGMIQRMGTGPSVIQRNPNATSAPSSTSASAPTTPTKTPAQQQKEKMDAERDLKVKELVDSTYTDTKEKLTKSFEKYLTTDSKATAIRKNVKDKVVSEIKTSMTAGTTEQQEDAMKYAQASAETIMIEKLKSYAAEVVVSAFPDTKKAVMKTEANTAYDSVTPSLNEAAFAKQKTKSASEAQKKLNTQAKTLITSATTTAQAEITAKFATPTVQGAVAGFDRIDVGTVGTDELTKRIGLDDKLVDQTVLRTENVDGTPKEIRDMENIYLSKLYEPLKKAILLKLGVGRGEFRRSKELNIYREGLKKAARDKVNAQIDNEISNASPTSSASTASTGGAPSSTPTSQSPASTIASSGTNKSEYMKMATKAIAHKEAKQLVDDVMAEEAVKIIASLLPKDATVAQLTNAGKTAAYDLARNPGTPKAKIQTASLVGANALADKLFNDNKDNAVAEARKLTKGTKATATTAAVAPDQTKADEVKAAVQDDTKTKALAKEVIKKSVEAPDLNTGFNKIGKLIDVSTPNVGDSSSLEFELKIPMASLSGAAQVYFLFGFGGEAEREADGLTVNTQLTFGAGFSTFGFDTNARFGLFLEGKGKDTDSVMNLLSYGLYREINSIKPAAAAHFWGMGGKSGDSKMVEAEKWAMMIEEQNMVDDAEVNVGGLFKLAMEANVGVAEFSAELAIKHLSKYNKDIIEKKGKNASGAVMSASERLANNQSAIGKGEINASVEAATEIEVGFGKDKVAFGVEGSMTKTKDEAANEWMLKELSLQLTASIPSQFGEESGDLTKYAAKIVTGAVGAGKNLSALLKKAFGSEQEADKKKRALGTTMDAGSDALFTGNYFDDIGASFAEKIKGDETVNDTMRSWLPGQDDSASAIEQVNKIALANALQLSVGFKKEYDGWGNPGNWEISLEASQVKSLEVDAEIVKVAVEKSKRLGKLEFAKGKTTKGEFLGFSGGGHDRPVPAPTQAPSNTGTSTATSTATATPTATATGNPVVVPTP